MRRIVLFLILISLLLVPVSAYSGITTGTSQTVVSENGSCHVTFTFTLQLESPAGALSFPLPAAARDITVNGAAAKSSRGENTRDVDLSGVVVGAGTYTVAIAYSLPDAVQADKRDNLSLSLQLLTGFGYPIDDFSFSVTLPGSLSSQPVFTSTYYQQAVGSVMEYTFADGVLSGRFTARLQDHETVTMTLPVTGEMFPQSVAKRFQIDTLDLFMMAVALLAVLYWVVTLRCAPPRRVHSTLPPEGITAGEVASYLTLQGADLTLMVLSWAQMGYILIHSEDSGRVLLHKRMEMGNERSSFERKVFRNLFGKRMGIDGTGYHYARLCRKVRTSRPGLADNLQKGSGNPWIFRGLMAIIGFCSGLSLAFSFSADTVWRVMLGMLLAPLGTAVAWLLQDAAKSLHSHRKLPALLAAGAAGLWLLLSVWADQWDTAIFVIPAQLVAGLAVCYGGRRSEEGMQNLSQLLGLRRHLKTVSNEDLKGILRRNPNYFYDLAPYALALDADKAFARQLGKRKLPGCSWLVTGMDSHMTAREWDRLLRETVRNLDALQQRLPFEHLTGK